MSTNMTKSQGQRAVKHTYGWLITALIVVPVIVTCGNDDASSDYTGEFGTIVESSAQSTDGPSSDDAVEMLREFIGIIVSTLSSLAWAILRALVCLATTGWIGIVVLMVAFFGAAIYYLRYRILRDDWHKALAVGVVASLPALILRILC